MLALALAALTLVPPVPGGVERPFAYAGDPFAAGHHRGVDLAAAPGEQVRAACSGRVTFAGRAGASGRAVTIRCGPWSVTHLPISPAVRAGDRVSAGDEIGAVGREKGHDGLHLGVREAADPLGYVDPAPLLRASPRPAPPAGPGAPAPRTAPRHAPPPGLRAPAPRPAPPPPHPAPQAKPGPAAGSSPLAPWPAWAGLALLLAGVAGAGSARVRRARRARTRRAPGPARRVGTVRP